MTTAELVKALAQRLGISQRQARSLLDDYVAAISAQLQQKNTVILRHFGSFSVKETPARRAYVPAKKAHCLIHAQQKVHFKAAKHLKAAVNDTDEHG